MTEQWWKPPSEELAELSETVATRLTNAGFKNAEQVRRAGPAALARVKGIGPVALGEIRRWLSALDGEQD